MERNTKKALRIDNRTVILVSPEKCNEEYARSYRESMGRNPNIKYGTNNAELEFSEEAKADMRRMHNSRRTYKSIANKYSTSITTIRRIVGEKIGV